MDLYSAVLVVGLIHPGHTSPQFMMPPTLESTDSNVCTLTALCSMNVCTVTALCLCMCNCVYYYSPMPYACAYCTLYSTMLLLSAVTRCCFYSEVKRPLWVEATARRRAEADKRIIVLSGIEDQPIPYRVSAARRRIEESLQSERNEWRR